MQKTSKDYLFVGVQFILFGLYFFDYFERFKTIAFLHYLALILAILGFLVALFSVFNLDRNLTVYPTPKNNSNLITSGFYKYTRHPIYSGIIFFTFGYSIYLGSIYKLIISVVLLIWFFLKSNYEEKRLMEKYSDYIKYRKITGRFFPKIKKPQD